MSDLKWKGIKLSSSMPAIFPLFLLFCIACIDCQPSSKKQVVEYDFRESLKEIDVLFVITTHPNSTRGQNALISSLSDFASTLEDKSTFAQNFHIGFITSYLGCLGCTHCSQIAGHDGILHNEANIAGLKATNAKYIKYSANGSNLPDKGVGLQSLIVTMKTMLPGLSTSCIWSQPLEALRRAMINNKLRNEGFFRKGALLALLFLENSDDCSSVLPEFYTDSSEAVSKYGFVSFERCFNQGAKCDSPQGDNPILLRNCRARDTGALVPLKEYKSILNSIYDDNNIVLMGISGPSKDIRAHKDQFNRERISFTCFAPTDGGVYPAVRLNSFVSSFGVNGLLHSYCDLGNLSTGYDLAMNKLATLIASKTKLKCLQKLPAHHENGKGCSVSAQSNSRTRTIPTCTQKRIVDPTDVCWRVIKDPSCNPISQFSLQIARGEKATRFEHVKMTCYE